MKRKRSYGVDSPPAKRKVTVAAYGDQLLTLC
jgi:hypothetical protein